ncbi:MULTISPECIES: hypothetical protein [Actinosynnema]|uniref:hypothetical protein n=1 Tax=Actinosynnema TaxID=40566 RepID=UPI0020A57D86|nr:hypothetical protein [Actinosynnema pretiosum]
MIDTPDTFGSSELKQNIGMGPTTACTARNHLGASGHLIMASVFAGDGDDRSRHQVAPGLVRLDACVLIRGKRIAPVDTIRDVVVNGCTPGFALITMLSVKEWRVGR